MAVIMVLKHSIVLLSLILNIGFFTIIETIQTTQKKGSGQLSTKQVKLLNSGDELFQQRNYNQAIEIYDKVMKQESVDPIYYDRRAICYLETGKLEKALTEFKNAVDSGRKTDILDAPLFADLGSKFCVVNKFHEALWCYSKAIEIDSSNRSYIYWRGHCNGRLKNIDEALSDFRVVIQMNPNAKDLPKVLADLINRIEKFDENFKETLSHLSKDGLVKLGAQLIQKERSLKFDEALYCFNTALEKDPDDVSIYNLRGLCYKTMHHSNEAIADFKKALSTSASHPPHHILCDLIETLFSVRKFEEAIKETRILNRKGLARLANHFLSKSRFESVLLIYDESIERYQSEASFYYLRGECYLILKEPVMANLDFAMKEQLLKIQAQDPEQYLTSLSHFIELVLSINYEKTVADRYKILLADELSYANTTQLLELAKRFFINDQLDESQFVCLRAIENYPQERKLFETLQGQIYDKKFVDMKAHL